MPGTPVDRHPSPPAGGLNRQSTFYGTTARGLRVDAGFQKLRKRIYQKMRGQTPAGGGGRQGLPALDDRQRSRGVSSPSGPTLASQSGPGGRRRPTAAPTTASNRNLVRSRAQTGSRPMQTVRRLPASNRTAHRSDTSGDNVPVRGTRLPSLSSRTNAKLTESNLHRLTEHFGDFTEFDMEERIVNWLEDCHRLWACYEGVRYEDLESGPSYGGSREFKLCLKAVR